MKRKLSLVNDEAMYVELKEEDSRLDIYFNRKGCGNEKRGHCVLVNGREVFQRSASALGVVSMRGSFYVEVSGALIYPIPKLS